MEFARLSTAGTAGAPAAPAAGCVHNARGATGEAADTGEAVEGLGRSDFLGKIFGKRWVFMSFLMCCLMDCLWVLKWNRGGSCNLSHPILGMFKKHVVFERKTWGEGSLKKRGEERRTKKRLSLSFESRWLAYWSLPTIMIYGCVNQPKCVQ
jgi:hypothetical protein